MKHKLLMGTLLVFSAVIVLDCGRKKATDPVGIALDTAAEALKKTNDPAQIAAALNTLADTLIALKEKNPEVLNNRATFEDSYKGFSEVHTEKSVAHLGNEVIGAAENRLLPLGLFK